MSDDEPTEEELREAEALVRALERGSAQEALPEDALETAALLAYSRDGGALSDERRAAILDDLLANAKLPQPKSTRGPSWLAWLLPAVGVAAAAGVALLVVVTAERATPPAAAGLPAPPPALLTAQAAAAGGTRREAEVLGERMQSYRGEVYAALEARYPRGGAR